MTAAEAQEIIRDEIGAVRIGGSEIPDMDRRIARYWNLYSSKSNIEVRMRYTKIAILSFLQIRVRTKVDTAIGTDRFSYSQMFRHLGALIDREEERLAVIDPSYNVKPMGSITPKPTLPDSVETVVDNYNGVGLWWEKP